MALSGGSSGAGAKTCRLCDENNGPFLNIFEFGLNLPMKIRRLLNVVINEWDNLPHKICYRCSTKVTEFYEFGQNCKKTQDKLLAKYGKGSKPNDGKKSLAKIAWEMKLKENDLSNDEYCDELIKKALSNFPLEDDEENDSVSLRNPIVFKDVRIVLTRVDDKKLNKAKTDEKFWLENWHTIKIAGIGTVYSCNKCGRVISIKSLTYSHICSSIILNNRKNNISIDNLDNSVKDDDKKKETENSTFAEKCSKLFSTSNGTDCLNQYLLKMPDNSFVLLRIVETNLINSHSTSHSIDDVKRQLQNVELNKNTSSVQDEKDSLNAENSKKSNSLSVKPKIGPLSVIKSRNSTCIPKNKADNVKKDEDLDNPKSVKNKSNALKRKNTSQVSQNEMDSKTKKKRNIPSIAKKNEDVNHRLDSSDDEYVNMLSEKHYKVSQNNHGKIIFSNLNTTNEEINQKRKQKKVRKEEQEVQSPTVIEALQNREFFTFVNIDPLLDASSANIDIVQESQISTTAVPSRNNQTKTQAKKKNSLECKYPASIPTALDICYICKKEFTCMDKLSSHLEKCFDKHMRSTQC